MGGGETAVEWHREADVVVIGSGATGMPAAIVAREAGASVIMVEAQPRIGGHAITSGGNLPLGGGTSYQKKYGIEDLPDLFFRDLTDWSVVEPNGFPPYRFNDREIIRAFADNSVADLRIPARAWRQVHRQEARDSVGHAIGISVLRDHADRGRRLADGAYRPAGRSERSGTCAPAQRPDAALGCRGAAKPASRSCSNTA